MCLIINKLQISAWPRPDTHERKQKTEQVLPSPASELESGLFIRRLVCLCGNWEQPPV